VCVCVCACLRVRSSCCCGSGAIRFRYIRRDRGSGRGCYCEYVSVGFQGLVCRVSAFANVSGSPSCLCLCGVCKGGSLDGALQCLRLRRGVCGLFESTSALLRFLRRRLWLVCVISRLSARCRRVAAGADVQRHYRLVPRGRLAEFVSTSKDRSRCDSYTFCPATKFPQSDSRLGSKLRSWKPFLGLAGLKNEPVFRPGLLWPP
jgi:hypothetical protein